MSELKKSHIYGKSVFVLLLLVLSLASSNAYARQARLDDFKSQYQAWPEDTAHQCVTCHKNNKSGGTSPYRTDLAANSFSFTGIESLDSDGDGVSNIDEILVGFHPSWKSGDSELAGLGEDISSFLTPENDLILTVVAPSEVILGTNITYVLTVENEGPQDATSVTASSSLPATMSFVSSDPSQGECSENNGVISCDLGRIDNGDSATISIIAETKELGTQLNQASVAAGQIELNSADNEATTSADVTAFPDSAFSPSSVLFLLLDSKCPANSSLSGSNCRCASNYLATTTSIGSVGRSCSVYPGDAEHSGGSQTPDSCSGCHSVEVRKL
ncbi:MAG: putative repeat protein (TIGR01451 family) [Gammaproteobacteria bacterium]|jgi:uncharacterized repeat protein (TIGR01451 family)